MNFSLSHSLILLVYCISFIFLLGFVRSSGAKRYGAEDFSKAFVIKINNYKRIIYLNLFFILIVSAIALLNIFKLNIYFQIAIILIFIVSIMPTRGGTDA